MLTKEKILEQINLLPDQVSIDDVIDRLLFVEKIEKRITASERGEVITDEQLANEMETWFKSNG